MRRKYWQPFYEVEGPLGSEPLNSVQKAALRRSMDDEDRARLRKLPLKARPSDARCNMKLKHFPDGGTEFVVADADIIRKPGFEAPPQQSGYVSEKPDYMDSFTVGKYERSLARAKRRARSAVADIARATDFSYFVTLTLDPSKINRYDVREITTKLNRWLDNAVRRHGLAYVLVAEHHKDGAVHFHGFFNDALPVVDSGTLDADGWKKPRKPRSCAERERLLADGARVVYNLPSWTLGYTTAIKLYGDKIKAVGYVTKYIAKAEDKVGGRWYYSGGCLQRPEVEYTEGDYAALVYIAAMILDDDEPGANLFTMAPEELSNVHFAKGGW